MEKQIIYQNHAINYKVSGKGETIVLLHGFMEDLHMWDYHQQVLSKDHQIICVDLPGHGKSGIWSESHGMPFMAKMVSLVLEEEKVDQCILIGHSMGGYVTLAFAEKFEQKLKGFGLFHSHAMADTEKDQLNRERAIQVVKNDKGGFINQFIPSLYNDENLSRFQTKIDQQIELANQMDPKGITAALAGMKDRSMRLDVLAFSNVPILYILGKHDSRIPLDKGLAQAATAPFSQINVLGKSGHMGWIEEADKSIAAILGFEMICKNS